MMFYMCALTLGCNCMSHGALQPVYSSIGCLSMADALLESASRQAQPRLTPVQTSSLYHGRGQGVGGEGVPFSKPVW